MKTTTTKRLLLLCLGAALSTAAASFAGEASVDGRGKVVTLEGDGAEADGFAAGVDPTIPADERLSATVRNLSQHRVDVYYDNGKYGKLISTLERDERTKVNTFVGHRFFVTRHGESRFWARR